jgi:nucleoside-diphosphate-sugar epimerase
VSGVLVIGAAGLIGRAILAQAGRTGTAEAVVARASGEMPHAHVMPMSPAAVDPLARLLERLEPTTILNSSGRTSGEPEELWRANVESVAAILEAMRRAAPRARLVHLGSAAEYAEMPSDTTAEDDPLAASTPYAASKLAAFKLVSEAAESGLDTVVARVFNPIGPRMPPTSLPGHAARLLRDAVVEGERTIELGPLGAVRDYVDLRDIATAVQVLASEASLAHRVYNVGSGHATVVRDLVSMIAERLEFAGEVLESSAGSPRSHDVSRRVADIARMRSTGWMPSVDLAASVDALAASIADGSSR